jgi:hypothetical protein
MWECHFESTASTNSRWCRQVDQALRTIVSRPENHVSPSNVPTSESAGAAAIDLEKELGQLHATDAWQRWPPAS